MERKKVVENFIVVRGEDVSAQHEGDIVHQYTAEIYYDRPDMSAARRDWVSSVSYSTLLGGDPWHGLTGVIRHIMRVDLLWKHHEYIRTVVIIFQGISLDEAYICLKRAHSTIMEQEMLNLKTMPDLYKAVDAFDVLMKRVRLEFC